MSTLWLIVNILLALYMTAIQALDLHTTSEGIKHRVAKEENDVLAGLLNSDEAHAEKFWPLALIKIGAAALSWLIAGIAWQFPELAMVAIAAQAVLAAYYTPIIVSNWQIYRRVR